MMKTVSITTTMLLCLVTFGCGNNKPIEQAPQAVETRTIAAQSAENGGGIRFSAVVMPDTQVSMAFRIPGYVVALRQVRGQDGRMRDIAEGDRVEKGTVLARIRGSEYEDKVHQSTSQVEAAKAAFEKAKLDYDRATNLFKTQSLTKPEFDAAQAQFDSAQAQLRAYQAQTAEAQVSLRDTTLCAPFSGDIVQKSVDLGAFVGPGVSTFAIANTDLVKIVIGVPDTMMRSIKLGQAVDVAIDAFPARNFRARVSRISSAADTTTRNFEVEVAIPNRDHALKPGMIGSLQLAQDPGAAHVTSLMVPLSSIVQANDGKYGVYVISSSGDGKIARLRSVQLGSISGTEITVVNGLASGEQIITSGANLLKDGQRVEVIQ